MPQMHRTVKQSKPSGSVSESSSACAIDHFLILCIIFCSLPFHYVINDFVRVAISLCLVWVVRLVISLYLMYKFVRMEFHYVINVSVRVVISLCFICVCAVGHVIALWIGLGGLVFHCDATAYAYLIHEFKRLTIFLSYSLVNATDLFIMIAKNFCSLPYNVRKKIWTNALQ